MLIGKDFKIESDPMNVILYRRSINKKTEQEYWRTEGYFSTVKNALKRVADYKVSKTGLKDLKTVSDKQDEIYKLIQSLTL